MGARAQGQLRYHLLDQLIVRVLLVLALLLLLPETTIVSMGVAPLAASEIAKRTFFQKLDQGVACQAGLLCQPRHADMQGQSHASSLTTTSETTALLRL